MTAYAVQLSGRRRATVGAIESTFLVSSLTRPEVGEEPKEGASAYESPSSLGDLSKVRSRSSGSPPPVGLLTQVTLFGPTANGRPTPSSPSFWSPEGDHWREAPAKVRVHSETPTARVHLAGSLRPPVC